MTSNPAAPDTPDASQSPNDLLASQITEALVAAGLIKDTHKRLLLSKLKTGGVKQEDWNLWIDMATAPQVAKGEAKDE
ncbi:MAG: hypothetical protein WD468_08385 [Pirellulales bacterium]